MKVRWTPGSLRFPALKGKLIVDTFRGQMRVRSWPRKTGPSKSAQVRRQVEWFKEANKLAKRVEPTQQALAIAMTKGTGLYPRDLLLRVMSGNLYTIIDEDGREYKTRQRFTERKVFQGVILELTAGLSLVANVGKIPNWPLPVLDTAGFWDVTAPSFITIPPGINVVELSAFACTTGTGNLFQNSIFGPTIPVFGEGDGQGYNVNDKTAFTGPIVVNAGDQFWNRLTSSNNNATRTDRRAFFSLNVLDAD